MLSIEKLYLGADLFNSELNINSAEPVAFNQSGTVMSNCESEISELVSGELKTVTFPDGVSGKQLPLPLTVREPFDLDYFVPHSGVAACLDEIKLALFSAINAISEENAVNPPPAIFLYVYGPRGCGKTHLAKGVCLAARGLGVFPTEPICVDDGIFSDGVILDSEDGARRFISVTESIRRQGGVCIVTSKQDAESSFRNPHVLSRLKSSAQFALTMPREEELKPVLISIFERRNLRVSQKTLEFLLQRLPADPLSFVDVVGRIDEFTLASGRSARGSAVREAIANYDE